MKITDLLSPESVLIDADIDSREKAISVLVDLHEKAGHLSDKEVYRQAVLKREAECATAIGMGLAIPHAKSDAVKSAGLAAVTIPGGIDCDALDGQPSNLIFMIAAPDDGDLHLEILSELVGLLMDENLRTGLLQAESPEAFLALLGEAEG